VNTIQGGHYEAADNYYKWDNITTYPQGYSWPDYNKFMEQCKQLGINVLIDVLDKPEWTGIARGAYSSDYGSLAEGMFYPGLPKTIFQFG